MKARLLPECRRARQEIWSLWPEGLPVPAAALEHARRCRGCDAELHSMVRLSRQAGYKGRPLAWSAVLPAQRWGSLASSPRGALRPAPPWARLVRWLPAALAAGLAAFLYMSARLRPMSPDVPPAALEKLELLENFELLENMDMLEGLARDIAPRRRRR